MREPLEETASWVAAVLVALALFGIVIKRIFMLASICESWLMRVFRIGA